MKIKFIFFILLLLNLYTFSFSNIMYNMPERMLLRDVNPNIKQKTQTQYKNVDDVKEQYKGRMKYKPSNDGINNYRYKKVYTNFYVSKNKMSLNKLLFRGVEQQSSATFERIRDVNSYEMNIVGGYYITNSLAIELEYTNMNYFFDFKQNKFFTSSNGATINKINTSFSAYTLNIMIENNYAKIIPFFGFGIGYLNNNFSKFYDTTVNENTEISGTNISINSKPVYNLFVGLEYAFSNKFLLSFRFKIISEANVKFLTFNKNNKNDIIDLTTKINIMSIGVKYIW